MMKRNLAVACVAGVLCAMIPVGNSAQGADPARLAPGQHCKAITQASADASAGTPNINHDGTALSNTPLPDISKGFNGIPRSPQPRLTTAQQRVLECTYHLTEANADLPYTLFVPSS